MNKKTEKLCEACSKGDLKAVIGLLNGSFFSKGLPPDVMSDNWDGMFGGMTPLMCASMYGKTEVVAYLISHGAAVNIVQPKGENTALIYAVANKHTEVVKILLQNKADITSKNKNGKTALQRATELNLSEIVSLFDNADVDLLGGLQALLIEARDWGSDNRFPLGKEYPQYNDVREIGIKVYKKNGSKGLNELMAQVKQDGSDLYTYLDLLWNHLKVGDEEVWLM